MNHILIDSYVEIARIEEFFILNEALSFDAISKKYTDLSDKASKILKDNDININTLKAVGKKIGSTLKKQYDSGKTPQDVSKMFNDQIAKATKTAMSPVLKKVKASKVDADDLNIAEKTMIVVGMLCLLFIVQTACIIPLAMTLGPTTARIISAVVFAPIFEEAIKTYFINAGMPWTGTAMMFGLEFIGYVMKMVQFGINLPAAIIVRTMALAMHFATTYVQKLIIDKATDPESQSKYMFAAWMAGVAIHMTWNTFGFVYNREIMSLLR